MDVPPDYLASVPVPVAREQALNGDVTIAYADVAPPPDLEEVMTALARQWRLFAAGFHMPVEVAENPYREGMAEYAIARTEARKSALVAQSEPAVDPVVTGSVAEPAERPERVSPQPPRAQPRASRYRGGKSPAASRSHRQPHKPLSAHRKRKRR